MLWLYMMDQMKKGQNPFPQFKMLQGEAPVDTSSLQGLKL